VGQHDDRELRARALEAGADRVVPYRLLFERGADTIGAWLARGPLVGGAEAGEAPDARESAEGPTDDAAAAKGPTDAATATDPAATPDARGGGA
jgi:hypothetical protein